MRRQTYFPGEFIAVFSAAVDALFQRLYNLIGNPHDATASNFLQSLHADALRNAANWQERFDTYLYCLANGGDVMPFGAYSVLRWSIRTVGNIPLIVFSLTAFNGGRYV
jgi:hypothetical protein